MDDQTRDSSRPPEKQPRVKAFDPLVLDRTVIALPLLQAMQEDLDNIEAIREAHPHAAEQFNTAIEYNPNYPGGPEAARQAVLQIAERAAKKAREVSASQQANAPESLRARMLKRHQAIEVAIASQLITPLVPGSNYGFANLHAAVVRRILNENERLASARVPQPKPIFRLGPTRFEIIIDLNLEYPEGREEARRWVLENIDAAKAEADVRDEGQELHWEKDNPNSQYLFARLEARVIRTLVELDIKHADAEKAKAKTEARTDVEEKAVDSAKDGADRILPAAASRTIEAKIENRNYRAIFHIWPDFPVSACINRSISTVKADAAQNSFSAHGRGVTWAVMDSGIKHDHPHFAKFANVDPTSPLHMDFTTDGAGPFDDENGHGTHVAGIIAGEWRVAPDADEKQRPTAVSRSLNEKGDTEYRESRLEGASGMAPRCQLVSLRVLDENGKGSVSNLIAAIAHVQERNGYGRRLLIHGVNMSLGYNFEPEWFACGQSPLCVEVDRLVKSGVVVVVAAGNTGFGTVKAEIGATSAGLALTINDPGNADLAITVGSTHRDMPHVYGVSYFSSKGPTGDGRLKPDLVAPGEKIISCATGMLKAEGAKGHECDYVESSGTSMAAPHVSGVIAAFLSVRGEFIGKPERVKELFVNSATDLRRDRYFQGAGLVDLMRAIQSV